MLRHQFGKNHGEEIFDELKKQFRENKRQTEGNILSNRDLLENTARMLELKQKEVSAWSFERNCFEPMKSGIHKVYKRGKKAHKLSKTKPQPSHFHQ